ncbi:GIY-YIG nuclease family protein [Blastococcus sp. TBT05-19]|uniref:GIY-YIG nuclease family protein n=1 Tax=Blastococcus sp. TBT05-19 TaxID=2250581 RepID=UPI000DEAD6C1|nr:GIY-YIG nuclease family protein [Blastococcus sp. TBT05-19]RBY90211.1 GIY-YIG nuclease family protein [Blastococcus sp. TBT05-19]
MQPTGASSSRGDLTLADLLDVAGIPPDDVLLVRHTYSTDGLTGPQDAAVDNVLTYSRAQALRQSKIPRDPPALWLNFLADGKRRSRFLTAYENRGEVLAERTDVQRYFDLHPSDVLGSLRNRLVIEWSADTINWAKAGARADQMPVVEIADPARVPFPGFDNVLVTHDELVAVVEDSRYAEWRTALAAVQGVYLVADTSSGELYVGKADGAERLLGRWSAYARDGHGGNVALRELAEVDGTHRRHFVFSILRVFGPTATTAEVDTAEAHYKRALLTRQYGLNRN